MQVTPAAAPYCRETDGWRVGLTTLPKIPFDGDKHLSPNFFNCWNVLLGLFTTVVLETAMLKRLRFDKNRIGIISSEAPTDCCEAG